MMDVGVQWDSQDIGGKGTEERAEDGEEMVQILDVR